MTLGVSTSLALSTALRPADTGAPAPASNTASQNPVTATPDAGATTGGPGGLSLLSGATAAQLVQQQSANAPSTAATGDRQFHAAISSFVKAQQANDASGNALDTNA